MDSSAFLFFTREKTEQPCALGKVRAGGTLPLAGSSG